MEATAKPHDLPTPADEREFLVNALLEVAERESRRIGQELHDHLCQVLLGAAFSAKAVALDLPASSSAAGELNELVRLISSAAKQTRDIARGLNPIELDSAGLEAALQQLISHPRAGFACRLEWVQPVLLPDARAVLHVYRIAQEAIANAVQHSGGTEIVVRITEDEESIHLQIADNGCGFAPGPDTRGGLGLTMMKYRVEAIDGRLRFDTREGGGTSVSCSLSKRK